MTTRRRGDPQLEDGHTRIANELLEALIRYAFRGGELKVVLAIIRLTYGWHLKARPIKQRELAQLTGLDERQIRRALTSLRQQAVVFRDRSYRPHRYQLNKRYFGWKHLPADLVHEAVMAARLQADGTPPTSNRSAMSAQPDTGVHSEADTDVPRSIGKEKKERVVKERAFEPTVENLLSQFIRLLKLPLTQDEHDLVAYLAELTPDQAQLLLAQVAQNTGGSDKPAGSRNGSSRFVEEGV